MRMMKRLLMIVCVFILPLGIVNNVSAYVKTGNIIIAFENEIAARISFSIYKIGDCTDESLVRYEPSVEFSNLEYDLNSLNTARDIENVIDDCKILIDSKKIQALDTQSGDKQGNVVFEDLEVGLYLVVQETYNENFVAESLIIQMPMEVDSKLEYDIEAIPKYVKFTDETNKLSDKQPTVYVKTSDDQQILPYAITLGISVVAFLLIFAFIKSDKAEK